MPHAELIAQTLIIFGVALLVGWAFVVLRMPAIIGFLFAGAAIGPSGLGLIPSAGVGGFAELGLILLLFTIGLELSTAPLLRIGPRLAVAAAVQISLTAVVGFVILHHWLGFSTTAAAIVGIALTNSSTAIILKHLADRGEADTTAGLLSTGTTLIQDVVAIAVMLFLPMIAAAQAEWSSLAARALFPVLGLVAVVVVARFTLPLVLVRVMGRGGRELLTLFAVVMACAGAWLAERANWSGALGAFIAGLLLASTDARYQFVAEVLPFRNVFNALFFMSLGMLVDVSLILQHAAAFAALVAVAIVLKAALTAGAVALVGWPARLALQVGVGLCTVSEFGYVVAHEIHRVGLMPPDQLDLIIAFAVGTMIVGAMLVPAADRIAGALTGYQAGRVRSGSAAAARGLEGHVIVIGYGLNGHNLAAVLTTTRIPLCVVELNRTLARRASAAGVTTVVGDATQASILDRAGLARARALVVAINDPAATRHVVAQARAARPDLYILARTRYTSEVDTLHRLGAREVIPEEFETSIEIFAHVLKEFAVPDNVIEAQIGMIRSGSYGMLRGRPVTGAASAELLRLLEATATQTFLLDPASPACGRTLRELDLRAATGVTIIAVVRSGRPTTNPPPDLRLEAGDVLVIVGTHQQLDAAKARLTPAGRSMTPPRDADS